MTRVSTAELTDRLPDILDRVVERGERFVVERDGIAVAVIQPPMAQPGPTLHQLPALLADVDWPDPDFFNELEVIRTEMNVPVEPPQWPS
jgi:antitoxin (DNA-binding transcriptional repressor) of toxin-antitoxin stability system